jgi:rhodanese-related sulfurtransferase
MISMFMPELSVRKRFSRTFYHVSVAILALISVLLSSPAGAQGWKVVDARTLYDWLQSQDITLVNVMSRIECLDHRIPGSRCIACEEFNENLPSIQKDKKLVIYCESEGCIRSCRSAGEAVKAGFEEVYVLEGGMPAWKHAGFLMESVQRIPRGFIQSVKAGRLKDWFESHPENIIVDIRSEIFYEEKHLEGAVNIPFYQLHSRYYELPWDRTVFVVDDRGLRSFLAACYLARKGFPVFRLFGGMEKWREVTGNKGKAR